MEAEFLRGLNKAKKDIEGFREGQGEARSALRRISEILRRPGYLPERFKVDDTLREISILDMKDVRRRLIIRAQGGSLALVLQDDKKAEDILTASVADQMSMNDFLATLGEELVYFTEDQDTVPARRPRDPFTGESKP